MEPTVLVMKSSPIGNFPSVTNFLEISTVQIVSLRKSSGPSHLYMGHSLERALTVIILQFSQQPRNKGKGYFSPLTDEETESQRGKGGFLGDRKSVV